MGGSKERCEGKRYLYDVYEDRDVATNRRYIDGTIIRLSIMKFDLTINVDGNPAQIYSLLPTLFFNHN